MLVTTVDIKSEYTIKGIVRFYIAQSPMMTAQIDVKKQLPVNEAIDYVIKNLLSKQAEDMGADAIIGLRIDSVPSADPFTGASMFYNIIYGTAVKLNP